MWEKVYRKKKSVTILRACLPTSCSSYPNLCKLVLSTHADIRPGYVPSLYPLPLHSLLWHLSNRGRWKGGVHGMRSYSPRQFPYVTGRKRNPQRNGRQKLLSRWHQIHGTLFCLTLSLEKHSCRSQKPSSTHALQDLWLGEWHVSEESLREPGLEFQELPCSLVIKDLLWTFFGLWPGNMAIRWSTRSLPTQTILPFTGLCGIQRAILLWTIKKRAGK